MGSYREKILCPVQFGCSVMSDSLQLHGLQPTKLLCPWAFSRQEYWSGLPYPPPGDLPNPGIRPRSPPLQVDSLPTEPPRKTPPLFFLNSNPGRLYSPLQANSLLYCLLSTHLLEYFVPLSWNSRLQDSQGNGFSDLTFQIMGLNL